MAYIDGFLIPVPKKNAAKYKKMSTLAARFESLPPKLSRDAMTSTPGCGWAKEPGGKPTAVGVGS